MATMGTSTERNEPRNRKMTTTTMSTVSNSVCSTSWMALSMYFVESNATRPPCRSAARAGCLDHLGAHALDDVERVRVGQDLDAHEDRRLAREAHLRVVVLGAEDDVGDVLAAGRSRRSVGG